MQIDEQKEKRMRWSVAVDENRNSEKRWVGQRGSEFIVYLTEEDQKRGTHVEESLHSVIADERLLSLRIFTRGKWLRVKESDSSSERDKINGKIRWISEGHRDNMNIYCLFRILHSFNHLWANSLSFVYRYNQHDFSLKWLKIPIIPPWTWSIIIIEYSLTLSLFIGTWEFEIQFITADRIYVINVWNIFSIEDFIIVFYLIWVNFDACPFQTRKCSVPNVYTN